MVLGGGVAEWLSMHELLHMIRAIGHLRSNNDEENKKKLVKKVNKSVIDRGQWGIQTSYKYPKDMQILDGGR